MSRGGREGPRGRDLAHGGAAIHYEASGPRRGGALVLLHGFAESLRMWDHLTAPLEAAFRLIRIDLPGHGGSGSLGTTHGMELCADAVKAVLDAEAITECAMLGHSMGGHVALAFAERHATLLRGLGLLHSSPFADTAERRTSRAAAIPWIEMNPGAYLAEFIPSLFTPANRQRFGTEIAALLAEAGRMDGTALAAAQRGLLERPDRSRVLAEIPCPVLVVAGKLDARVRFEAVLAALPLPRDLTALLLHEVGHMGQVEAPDAFLHAIAAFAGRTLGVGEKAGWMART